MVELTLPRQLHALGQRAIGEAVARRASTVEAEHLLLAILADSTSPAATALEHLGLTSDRLSDALGSERARSLAAAGIAPPSHASMSATPRTTVPGWGASIRDVLRGSDKPAAKDGRPGALELELARAILTPVLGTVPRAIALAGLDRITLIATLTGTSG